MKYIGTIVNTIKEHRMNDDTLGELKEAEIRTSILEEPDKLEQTTMNWAVGITASLVFIGASIITVIATVLHMYFYLPINSYDSFLASNYTKTYSVFSPEFIDFNTFSTAKVALSGKIDEAVKASDRIEAQFLYAQLLDTLDEDDEALGAYDAFLTEAKGTWYQNLKYEFMKDDAYSAKAVIYYEQGNIKAAKAEIDSILDIENVSNAKMISLIAELADNPNSAHTHFMLGKVFKEQLKLEQARTELDLAYSEAADPQFKTIVGNYRKARMPNKDFNLTPTGRYYALMADAQDKDVEANNDDVLQQRTFILYRKALKENPGYVWGYHHLGLLHMEQKHYKQAANYTKNALKLDPQYYLAHLTLADIEMEQDHFSKAIQHFEKALSIIETYNDPSHKALVANIQNQIGYSLESVHKNKEAINYYKQAAELSEELINIGNVTYDETHLLSCKEDLYYASNSLKRLLSQ